MKKLYSHIGNKVMALAKFLGIVGLISVIIGVLLLLADGFDDFGRIMFGVCGGAGAVLVVLSWPIYAFGQITNDVRDIKTGLENKGAPADEIPNL